MPAQIQPFLLSIMQAQLANSMALSLYSTLNWSVVPDQYHCRIRYPPAAREAPQLLMSAALPTYSPVNATASPAYSSLNSKRHSEIINADPLFFNKGHSEYNISHDTVLADNYCSLSDPGYCNHCSNYNHADLLDPAAANLFSPVIDPPKLGSCYEINDHLQQQLSSGPRFLGLHGDYEMNLGQAYHYQVSSQLLKRYKSCFDGPDLSLVPNIPYPPVQLPELHVNGISCKLSNVEEGMEKIIQRPRRVLAQSLAARERRKKIADKMQELGKLIPGGSKMNTAEMLQSAFNYVKFLQSQVHILQLMSSLNPSQVPATPMCIFCVYSLI